MFLTMLAVVITVISIVILNKTIENNLAFFLWCIFTVCGAVTTFTMVACIICAHVGVDAQIEKNRIKYESLCERQEIAISEYEDVSKSDVIKDIAKWNIDVYSEKYWANNPWTNWFYSKRLADSLEMIEIE